MFQVSLEVSSSTQHYIIHHGGNLLGNELLPLKELLLPRTCLPMNIVSHTKGDKKYHWITVMQGTGHPGNTPGCIFPCFLPENPSCIHFAHPYAPHDIIAAKMYALSKFEVNQTDGSQDTAISVSYPSPVFLI